MSVKLSDLFTQQSRKTSNMKTDSQEHSFSTINEDSKTQEDKFLTFNSQNNQKHMIQRFKNQIKQSINIINSPKSNLFGHSSVNSWTKQDLFKSSQKSINPIKLTTDPSRSIDQVTRNRINTSTISLKKQAIIENDPLKQAKKVLQSRKFYSAEWANLKEGIQEQLDRKQHTTQTQNTENSQSLNLQKSISMKERMKTVNDQNYKQRFGLSVNVSFTHDQRKDDCSRNHENSTQLHSSKFGTSSQKFFIKESFTSQNKQKNEQNILTEQFQKEDLATNTQNNKKFQHQMLSSICMAQIKQIKGGRVKKSEKEKFENYYDSVSERLQDMQLSRTQNKFDFSKINDFNWQMIRYQPAYLKGEHGLKEVRDLYLKEKIAGAQNKMEAILFNRDNEESIKKQNQSQKREDNYIDEYRKKTFFLYKNLLGETGNLKNTTMQRMSKIENKSIDFHSLFSGVQTTDIKQKEQKEKFKKIRIQIKEYLQKHFTLGISLKDSMINSIFKRVPYDRPESENFFTVLKQNDIEKVKEYLYIDKYLVYQFDCTQSTPLHWAAKRGYMKIAQILIDHNCDIDCKDEVNNLLFWSIICFKLDQFCLEISNVEQIFQFIQRSMIYFIHLFHKQFKFGRTPLYYAYREGYNDMGKLLLLKKALPWSSKKNNIDQAIYSRSSNDKMTIKIAKQVTNKLQFLIQINEFIQHQLKIHLMMMMAKFKQKQKIWDETKYLFEDKQFKKDMKIL